jgi:hypothetical protein
MQSLKPEDNTSVTDILKLWRNEMMRVFTDGLASDSDRTWLSKLLTQAVASFFKVSELDLEEDVLFLDPTVSSWVPKLTPSSDLLGNFWK